MDKKLNPTPRHGKSFIYKEFPKVWRWVFILHKINQHNVQNFLESVAVRFIVLKENNVTGGKNNDLIQIKFKTKESKPRPVYQYFSNLIMIMISVYL